jgi:two-component system nitrate/nitrite response regulator NarL
MNLLIVNNDLSFSAELAAVMAGQADPCVTAEARYARQAIEMARKLKPEVIVMDYSLPDRNGLDTARAILAERPETQIILLGMVTDDRQMLEGFRMGIKGYLPISISPDKLVAAVCGMLKGEAPLSREMTGRLIAQLARSTAEGPQKAIQLDRLTGRELEVLGELAGGLSNQQIAAKLVVSENTVRNHVHKILDKLGLRSRREAGALAKRYGLSPVKVKKS